MGLSGLNSALAGLRVSSQQIDVISNNVSNVGTPGFSRKILPQSAQGIAGISTGVRAETIIRNVSSNLTRDLFTQISAVGALSVQEDYLSRIEQFHGAPDQEISVAAEISQLRDTFAALADSPENSFLLGSVVDQASDTAGRLNALSDLVNSLRNDAQTEIGNSIDSVNALLEQIATLNDQVALNGSTGRSTALLEDQRDSALSELSDFIEISTFTRGDGVVVVQTREGIELADDRANQLFFEARPLSADSFHFDPASNPDSISGIFVGDPSDTPVPFDLTTRDLGGKLGGLIELRDVTFPKQAAQVDELAYQTAIRFEAQGLRLFTDAAGNIPLNTPPDPTTIPPTPVEYVGFASSIRVNEAVLQDNTLLRSGTNGASILPGSSEVISRVLEFTFGSVEFQQAVGDINLRVSGFGPPNNTLQNFLGVTSESRLVSSVDLSSSLGVADILAAGGEGVFGGGAAPQTDTFSIIFEDPDLGVGPHEIEIDLRALIPSGVSAAQDIINGINADPDFANAVADFGASVSVNGNGQLVFESRGDVRIAPSAVEPLSNQGFAFLGLNPGLVEAEDPYFEVAVGNNAPTRIIIEPGDTEVDLLAKLNATPDLAVEDITISPDGFLRLRPGDDFTDPNFGGGLTITGGPFQSNNAGANAVFGPGTITDGVNISAALFGSFNAGPPVESSSPIADVFYGSETNGSLGAPIPTVPFRTSLLGPNASVSSNIIGATSLTDFSQRIVNEQTQDLILVQNELADEDSLRGVLQTQLLNESGVNLDEELGNLIVVQTAFSASARVVTAIDELFQELLNAVR